MGPAPEIDIQVMHDQKSLNIDTLSTYSKQCTNDESVKLTNDNVENASVAIFRSHYSGLIKQELNDKPDTDAKDQIMDLDQDVIGAKQQRHFHHLPLTRNPVSTSKFLDGEQYTPNRTELPTLSDPPASSDMDTFGKQSLSDDSSSMLKPLR